MSVTITPPGPVPADQPPIPVDLTKQQPAPDAEPTWAEALTARIRERIAADGDVRAHLQRARSTTWSWLTAERVTEEELAREVLTQRQHTYEARERELRNELSRVTRQLTEHKIREARADAAMRSAGGHALDGHEHGRHRDSATDTSLRRRKEELEVLLTEHGATRDQLDLDPTKGEISRARWGRRTSRAAVLVGSVIGGGIVLPAESSPLWLLASLPAGMFALWRAGAVQKDDTDGQPVAVSAMPGIPTQAAGSPAVPSVPAADAQWPAPEQLRQAGADGTVVTVVAGTLPADPSLPPTGTFPIARVTSPQWAGECIRRALVKEGVPVAELFDVARQPWGWTCSVRISEGSPAAVIKVAESMETLLDLDAGRFIPTPTRRRAVIDLKVAMEDPFAFVPGPPRRAPKSMSIRDKAVLGYAMDGRPVEMSLYGQQGAIVAGSGGGKSANIRTFAEYLTACRDVVLVCLDPSGVGLGPLGEAAALTLTSKEEIECYLRGAHQVSLKRPELLGRLKMGTEWQPSERWPALVAIGDEWPQTTAGSKEAGEGIFLTGRKVCDQLLIASQFATQDYIGSAIISNLALQVLGPCRQADVTATFGGGAIDGGWLPNRLVPKQADELNDVGKFYLRGGGYNEPIIWKGNWYDDQTCAELAAERAQAGIPQLDEESLKYGGREFAGLFERHGTTARQAKQKAAAGDRILTDVIAVLRAEGLDRARTERIAQLLQATMPTDYAGITGAEVGDRIRRAGGGGTVKLGPTDGMANPNGYRLVDLVEAADASN